MHDKSPPMPTEMRYTPIYICMGIPIYIRCMSEPFGGGGVRGVERE